MLPSYHTLEYPFLIFQPTKYASKTVQANYTSKLVTRQTDGWVGLVINGDKAQKLKIIAEVTVLILIYRLSDIFNSALKVPSILPRSKT